MRTIRRYLWWEIASASLFVLFALLALFLFFDMVAQLDEIGRRGFRFRDALFYVALTLPSRTYELMPIAALIGTIYTLSKLAANSEFTIMRVSGMSTRRLMGSLLGIGLIIVALTYLLGEFISPPAEQLAQKVRLQATGSPISVREFRSGVWVRDVVKDQAGGVAAFRFINVRQVQPDAATRDWRVFEFDRDYKLRSMMTAETGVYSAGAGWILSNVVETKLPAPIAEATVPNMEAARTEVVKSNELAWLSELKPDIFGVMIVQPERMAGWDLAQYIQHLSDNRQQTERYEIALWSKLFYPWAVLVMMMLALPFAFLHVRSGGVSLKIFTGVMIGVAFYGLNKLFAHLGLLNTWPPIVVAALPSLVVLAMAMSALHWIERR
ncbi:MAG: LPS export ABC transporter permease LptG [Burkholderiaceae bacterium]|nr:LPS export ABC transporter permease LptG [Burkholderiaceae bacterium]